MAASYRSSASASDDNTDANQSITITKPTGTVSGDVLIAILTYDSGSGVTANTPAGWTLIRNFNNSTNIKQASFYKVAGGSEPSSYAFTYSADVAVDGGIICIQNADNVTVVDVSGTGSTGSGVSPSAASITTTGAADILIVGWSINDNVNPSSDTNGMTNRVNQHSSTTNAIYISTLEGVAAGATGAKAITYGASKAYAAVQIAVLSNSNVSFSGQTIAAAGTMTGAPKFAIPLPSSSIAAAMTLTGAPKFAIPLPTSTINVAGTLSGTPGLHPNVQLTSEIDIQATLSGAPTFTEHRGLMVTMAGQDISDYIQERTIDIKANMAQGSGTGSGSGRAGTCEFLVALGPAATAIGSGQTIPPGPPALVRQGEVIIYDAFGNRVYGGFATHFEDATDGVQNFTLVTCSDFWQSLESVTVDERYINMADTDIIADLITKYASWVDLSDVVMVTNLLVLRKPFRGSTVRFALQAISNLTGFAIWVDAYKKLQYVSPASASTAPFSLHTNPDETTSYGHQIEHFVQDDTSIINKVRFYGGNRPSPDFTQDLSPQANGNNKVFVLAYYPYPTTLGDVPVYVGGVLQNVGAAFGDTTNPDNVYVSQGGNADALMDKSAKALIFDTAPVNSGINSVTITYRYQIPTIIETQDIESVTFFGRTFDSSLSDETVFDPSVAYQRSRVVLAQQSFGLTSLQVVCWQPGILPGMLLHVTNTLRGIDDSFQVQSVEVEPLGGGEFAYHISLGAWNWNLVDLLLAQANETNIDQNDDDIATSIVTVEQYNEAMNLTFSVTYTALDAGGYFARLTAVGDGHDAYAGLSTIID